MVTDCQLLRNKIQRNKCIVLLLLLLLLLLQQWDLPFQQGQWLTWCILFHLYVSGVAVESVKSNFCITWNIPVLCLFSKLIWFQKYFSISARCHLQHWTCWRSNQERWYKHQTLCSHACTNINIIYIYMQPIRLIRNRKLWTNLSCWLTAWEEKYISVCSHHIQYHTVWIENQQ